MKTIHLKEPKLSELGGIENVKVVRTWLKGDYTAEELMVKHVKELKEVLNGFALLDFDFDKEGVKIQCAVTYIVSDEEED